MYALWLLPKREDETYLTKQIERLCQIYDVPKFVPHITVYGIINVDLTILEEAAKYSIQGILPFAIKKSDLSHSDNVWKTIYIDIELNDNLDLIHKRLSQTLSQYLDYQFMPHISLIYKKMGILERLKTIREIDIKNQFIIDKIAIMEFSENINEWKLIKTIAF